MICSFRLIQSAMVHTMNLLAKKQFSQTRKQIQQTLATMALVLATAITFCRVSPALAADQASLPTADQASLPTTASPATQIQTADKAAKLSLKTDLKNLAAQYKRGRYILAEQLGRDILNRDPSNLDAHYLMGNIYYKLDDTKSAELQYNYCVQTGHNSNVAKLATGALASLKTKLEKIKENDLNGTADGASRVKPVKLADLPALKHAVEVLEKAQGLLKYKKEQLDTMVGHAEEFARSRIKEIPLNTIYRRMSAFGGTQASRDNEDYYTAPNYERTAEVTSIRTTETAKVRKYIEDYNLQQKTIVTTTLKEVDKILGDLSEAESKPLNTATAHTGSGIRKPQLLTDSAEACTACGITTSKESAGHRVIVVATGSAAHRAGLAPGDLIRQEAFSPQADLLKLTFSRGDHNYSLKLHPQASASLKATVEAPAATKRSPEATSPKLTSSQLAWARIKGSEIVFIEDMSSNMRQPLGETGLSRWDWCAGRILDFAETLSQNFSASFTLVQCYQYVYEIYRDQNSTNLRQRFVAARAIEASNVSLPLTNVAIEHLDSQSRKPLLILVFTDGHPQFGESIEAAVQNIVDRVKNPDQIRLVFFQVGDDPQGTAMMHLLDNDLTYTGLKYDIVDWVSFAELQDLGVNKALLDAYERPRSVGKTETPAMAQALETKLEAVRNQIASVH